MRYARILVTCCWWLQGRGERGGGEGREGGTGEADSREMKIRGRTRQERKGGGREGGPPVEVALDVGVKVKEEEFV